MWGKLFRAVLTGTAAVTLAILNPLVLSLSALLIALDGVVGNLLLLVKAIVDALLIGLSLGLAGLVL